MRFDLAFRCPNLSFSKREPKDSYNLVNPQTIRSQRKIPKSQLLTSTQIARSRPAVTIQITICLATRNPIAISRIALGSSSRADNHEADERIKPTREKTRRRPAHPRKNNLRRDVSPIAPKAIAENPTTNMKFRRKNARPIHRILGQLKEKPLYICLNGNNRDFLV